MFTIYNFPGTQDSEGVDEPIQLSPCQTITNPALFISRHLELVRHHKNKRWYKPYFDRLVELMEMEV